MAITQRFSVTIEVEITIDDETEDLPSADAIGEAVESCVETNLDNELTEALEYVDVSLISVGAVK